MTEWLGGVGFLERILIAGLLASVAAGIMGTFVVVKRMASVTGGLAHAAFGGVGLGYLIGIQPLFGAALFGLLSGVGVGVAYRRLGSALDTAISMVWSAGMAIGVVAIALSPGYAPDLTSYLFGSILFASWSYVAAVLALDVAILVITVVLYRALQAVSFDEEFSEVLGLPVDRLIILLLVLVAVTVVTLIQVVGVILAIALLTIPAETARHWSHSLLGMMTRATLIGATATTCGILGSYELSRSVELSVPSGPLIILICIVAYLGSRALRGVVRKRA
ncbi:MAG: metal ABC transporter permease [Candidatus Eiseniibacteriota bacterium]